jgi:surface carbohydrate biosynthesis protein
MKTTDTRGANSGPVDVAIVVDQKWRDLPGAAALAVWLQERHGLTAVLLPYGRWREILVSRTPRALIVTHMNGSRNAAIAEVARRMGARVIVIQTEGRPNNLEIMEYAVGRDLRAEAVDLWFTWSETVRDYMLQRSTMPAAGVIAAGPHRFDIYRAPLNALIAPRASFLRKYGLDPGRQTVTLATNFTCTKYYRTNAEFLRSDWKDLGLSSQPSFSQPEAFAAADFEAREKTLEIARGLLANRPTVQLLIKPHPTEEHQRYREFVAECNESGNRVAFIGLEYIWDVLNASDVHIHRMCTTGVEAWFLDVPSVELHVMDYHAWSLSLPGAASEAVAGCDLVRDLDGLLASVDHYLAGGRPSVDQIQARAAYITKWLLTVDGHRNEAHADAIARLLESMPRSAGLGATAVDRLKVAARAALRKLGSRTWGSEPVDRLGQVDCRIADDDAALWLARVRAVLAPHISGKPPEPVAAAAGIELSSAQ